MSRSIGNFGQDKNTCVKKKNSLHLFYVLKLVINLRKITNERWEWFVKDIVQFFLRNVLEPDNYLLKRIKIKSISTKSSYKEPFMNV